MHWILAAFLSCLVPVQEPTVDSLVQKLGSSDFEEQGKAAAALERRGGEALDALKAATRSGNPQIRDWAVKVIARIEKSQDSSKDGQPAAFREWLDSRLSALSAPDASAREKAAVELKSLGKPVVPFLKEALLAAGEERISKALESILEQLGERVPKIEAAAGWINRFPCRTVEKAKLLATAGGTEDTEEAVRNALRWLARHQSRNGAWGAETFRLRCVKECQGAGHGAFDVGTTGLALLAFLGAGHGIQSEEPWTDPAEPGKVLRFGTVVRRGLAWLLSKQGEGGCIGEPGEKHLYNHLIASQALAEAVAMSGSPDLRAAVERATRYTIAAQNPGKAWRYNPLCNDNDTSVTGWAVASLKAAEGVDLGIPKTAYAGALSWLEDSNELKGFYQAGYNARGSGQVYLEGEKDRFDDHPTMTGIGILCRLLIQKKRSDPAMAGIALLKADLPEWKVRRIDFYSWHWEAQAVFQLDGPQGSDWKKWFDAAKRALLDHAERDAGQCGSGSWDPEQDRWGRVGGRVYATALGALVLETPYRHPMAVPVAAPAKKK